MDAIRIGISPYETSVKHCLSDLHATENCLRRPGSEIEPLLVVLKWLNLNYTFVVSNVKGCGYPVKENVTENRNNLMQMIIDDVIDITGNLCSFKPERTGPIGTGLPLFRTKHLYIIRKERVQNYKFNPTAAFTWETWLAVVLAVAFINLLILLLRLSKLNKSLSVTTSKPTSTNLFFLVSVVMEAILLFLYETHFESMYITLAVNPPKYDMSNIVDGVLHGRLIFIHEAQWKFHTPGTGHWSWTHQIEEGVHKYGAHPVKHGAVYARIVDQKEDFGYVFAVLSLWYSHDQSKLSFAGKLEAVEDRSLGGKFIGYLFSRQFKHSEKISTIMGHVNSVYNRIQEKYNPSHKDSSTVHVAQLTKIKIQMLQKPFVLVLCCFFVSILVFAVELTRFLLCGNR